MTHHMAENIKQVAERIRTMREIKGETVENLAQALKISPDEYRSYEGGATDIPLSILYSVANHFTMELTALLTGEEPRMRHFSLVRGGSGPSVERKAEYQYQDLAYNFARKKVEAFLVTIVPTPEEEPGPFSRHLGQEFNYCLEGTLKIFVDKNELTLHSGDSLFFDSGCSHAMTALGTTPAKFLAIIA